MSSCFHGLCFLVFNYQRCEFESRSWRGLLDAALCDNVCQCLTAGRWLSAGTPVFSTNNTDRHDITEILLKVALNTIILNPPNKNDIHPYDICINA